MRRLTLQFSWEDLNKVQPEVLPKNLESTEVLHILKQDRHEVAVICRVTLKDPSLEGGLFHPDDQVQLLEKSRDGVCTYFIKTKLHPGSLDRILLMGGGGYFSGPFEIKDDKVTITFLGSSRDVRKLLQRIDKLGITYKLISLIDARFSQNSPLSQLTDKQRKVLITAYNLGYYDLPKRISSEQLARKLNMRSSTLIIHRIKAERRLIKELLDGR